MVRERSVLGGALAMIGGITILNLVTPAAIGMNHLYTVPVLVVAWRAGLRSGLIAAGFSELGWIASLSLSGDRMHFSRFALTGASLFLVLVLIAFVIGRLHGYFRTRDVPVELYRRQEDSKNVAGLMHTCAWCKRIKNANGQWVTLESYLGLGGISHGICPECKENLVGIEDGQIPWRSGLHIK